MPEIWLPVFRYEEHYAVSNLGRVRNARGVELNPSDNGHGYLVVSLCREGVCKNHRLHKVVLSSFCGPEPFPEAHAAHNNGVKTDCRLVNLRWATPRENQGDRAAHGTKVRGAEVYGAVLTEEAVREIRECISSGLRNRPIAEAFGVSISTIHLIRHGKIWRHVL